MISKVIYLYEGRTDVSLTTYVLEDSMEMLAGKPRPAVLICPGGAYISCSDREGEPVALRFAAMGYHAFVLRYSTYMEGKPGFITPGEPMPLKAHCQYPNPMREIGMAMLLLHEHAKAWKIDTERIAICGFSAGAHNCAMYATQWQNPVITEFFGKPKEMLRPAACIWGYTLSDYIFMKGTLEGDPIAKGLFDAANTSYLGTSDPDDDMLLQVSPARNVTADTPPMFLWATAADGLVPVQHTIRMAHALADQNIPFEMHVFEEGDHGLALATQASSTAWDQTSPDAEKWAELCEKWLSKRFALPLKDTFRWQ